MRARKTTWAFAGRGVIINPSTERGGMKRVRIVCAAVLFTLAAHAVDEPWFGAPIPGSGYDPAVLDCGMSAAKVFDAPIEGLKKIGTLAVPKSADLPESSNASIGFEGLDRGLFDPDRCYDALAAAGIKWARVQTMWSRCEKVKGKYDFSVLDAVVENLTRRGVRPWFCVSFGNTLYMTNCFTGAAVGCVPTLYGAECRAAWCAYVRELAKRYKGKVTHWEIWNEPNIDNFWQPTKPNAAEYLELVKLTGGVIREVIPDAKIGGVTSSTALDDWARNFFKLGGAKSIDFWCGHAYGCVPERFRQAQKVATESTDDYVAVLRDMRAFIDAKGGKHIEIWQGESGFPSWFPESHWLYPRGVCKEGWQSQANQAKWMLRRYVTDRRAGIARSSFYQMADISRHYSMSNITKKHPAEHGIIDGWTYKPKMSYHAFGNYNALLATAKYDASVEASVSPSSDGCAPTVSAAFRSADGSPFFLYYTAFDFSLSYTGACYTARCDAKLTVPAKLAPQNPVLVDMLRGGVYEVSSRIEGNGNVTFAGLPLVDYPLVLADRLSVKLVGTLPVLEVPYGSDPQQTGDLFLPAKVTPETPFVLNIHGGGWSAMSRKDAAGVSAFLVERGCAVYSIDYRLASKANPWPACGDDCLKAAEFILRGGFAAQGLKPNCIWVIGVSAGGHLALWTGLNLKAEQVAGIISVSGIADPIPDAKANPNRYVRLFGGRETNASDLDSMSIMKLVRKNGPRILLTHAREDTVVPIDSAANFCNSYRNAGNNIFFYQYSAKDEANTGGHAIWRKDWSDGKRLLKCIENEIEQFIGTSRTIKTAENIDSDNGAEVFEPERQFRGVWVATVYDPRFSEDLSKKSVDGIKAYWLSILDAAERVNVNAVFFQVRPCADAFYKSELEPWSLDLRGEQGKAPEGGFDPLQFMIDECHARGMQLHAWFNPFRVTYNEGDEKKLAKTHNYFEHPDWFVKYGKSVYYDPGIPACRDWTVKVVMDVAARYDIDGIHIDDYFYPYAVQDGNGKVIPFPDEKTYKQYGMGFETVDNWRGNNVDLLVADLAGRMRDLKPDVGFGVSPYIDNDYCLRYLYCDSLKWARNGWIDYLIPQMYACERGRRWTFWWDSRAKGCPLFAGRFLKNLSQKVESGSRKGMSEFDNMVEVHSQMTNLTGVCWWSAQVLMQNVSNVTDRIAAQYPRKTLVPLYRNRSRTPPPSVVDVRAERRDGHVTLHWRHPDGDVLHKAVFTAIFRGNERNPVALVQGTSFDAGPSPEGIWRLVALDRLQNAAEPSVVTVKQEGETR